MVLLSTRDSWKLVISYCIIIGVITVTCCNAQASYNEECDDSRPSEPALTCDTSKYLKCSSSTEVGRCICLEDAEFDFFDDTCYLVLEQSCSEPPTVPVTTNAECDTTTNTVRCKQGFSHSLVNGNKCVKNREQSCTTPGKKDECDKFAYLECIPPTSGTLNICDCEPNYFFETSENKCMIKANTDCTPPGIPADVTVSPCTPRSTCKPDGTTTKCQCDGVLSVNQNGRCFVPFEGSCGASPLLCDEDAFLKCDSVSSTCKCRPGAHYIKDVACHLQVGSSCGVEEKCTPFSTCDPTSSTCQCEAGLEISNSSTCVTPHEQTCGDLAAPCNEDNFIFCDQNALKCMCESTSWYITEENRCVLKAGSTCESGEGKQGCTPNANCVSTGATSTCTCVGNLEENSEGKCGLFHGQLCSLDDDLCHASEFLECIRGEYACGCKDRNNTVYQGGKCRLKAEVECVPGAQECVQGAVCDSSQPLQRCKCEEGYEVGSVGNCVIPYGRPCDQQDTITCDSDGYQKCNITCICGDPSTMEFDPKTKKCVLKIGKECVIGEGIQCGENLVCDSTEKICACDSALGLIEENGACVRTINSTCTVSTEDPTGGCSSQAHLECSEGKCQCQNDYLPIVVGDRAKCVGLQNVPCTENEDCHTGGSLTCRGGTAGSQTCQCSSVSEQEYVSDTKRCWTNLNGACNELEEGSSSISLDCNPIKHLVCSLPAGATTGGKCVCDEASGWVLSLDGNVCVSSVGRIVGSAYSFCLLVTLSIAGLSGWDGIISKL